MPSPVNDDVAAVDPMDLLTQHIAFYWLTHSEEPPIVLVSYDIFAHLVDAGALVWYKQLDLAMFEGIDLLCLEHLPVNTIYSPIAIMPPSRL